MDMQLDNYYEDLSFAEGKKIIISKKISADYAGNTHWHPYAEILLSLQDGNSVTVNFNKYTLKPNDLIIIYPGDLHSVENVSQESFLIIQFPINLITVMNDINRILPILYKTLYCPYDPCNVENDRMILTLKKIDVLCKSEHPFVEVDIYSLLLTFFSLFCQHCVSSGNAQNTGNTVTQYKSSKLMAEACLYIAQNCAEPLTLDMVAHQLGISRSYFSHLFKDYTQMTFIDYLIRERINKAETLFLGPKKKIIDIAFECGFSSISSFNRTFKKVKGISPTEFRDAMIQPISKEDIPQ